MLWALLVLAHSLQPLEVDSLMIPLLQGKETEAQGGCSSHTRKSKDNQWGGPWEAVNTEK